MNNITKLKQGKPGSCLLPFCSPDWCSCSEAQLCPGQAWGRLDRTSLFRKCFEWSTGKSWPSCLVRFCDNGPELADRSEGSSRCRRWWQCRRQPSWCPNHRLLCIARKRTYKQKKSYLVKNLTLQNVILRLIVSTVYHCYNTNINRKIGQGDTYTAKCIFIFSLNYYFEKRNCKMLLKKVQRCKISHLSESGLQYLSIAACLKLPRIRPSMRSKGYCFRTR